MDVFTRVVNRMHDIRQKGRNFEKIEFVINSWNTQVISLVLQMQNC